MSILLFYVRQKAFFHNQKHGYGEARQRLHPAKEPTNGDVCRKKRQVLVFF
jgi:hypothetical protein